MKTDVTRHLLTDVSLALALAMALAACGEHVEDGTTPQKSDATTSRARDAKNDAKQAATGARSKLEESSAASSTGSRDPSTSVMGAAADARDKAYGTPGGESRTDDNKLTAMVLTGLKADKELNPLRIDVDTREGVVTLSGSVPSAAAKARASEIAMNVKDVKSVNNQLTLTQG